MALKFEGKEMYSIFVFAKCYWSILGKNAHSKPRNATPTQTMQFLVKFMYMSCYFSIYIVYIIVFGLFH